MLHFFMRQNKSTVGNIKKIQPIIFSHFFLPLDFLKFIEMIDNY